MNEDQFARLPEYAKREIRNLRESVERIQAKVDWLEDENRVKVSESNTVVSQGIGDNTALIPFSDIDFYMRGVDEKKHWKPVITARVSRDQTCLEIMGADQISVAPQAGNVVHISLR